MDIHDFLIILNEMGAINELSKKCSEEDLIRISSSLDEESRKQIEDFCVKIQNTIKNLKI